MRELETIQKRNHSFSIIVITVLMVSSLICIASIYSLNEQVTLLQSEVANLQSATETATTTQDNVVTTTSNTESISLAHLYETVADSVVTIDCTVVEYTIPFRQQIQSEVQGSGFVYEYEDQMVIVTNDHVIKDAVSITVTFADGKTYDAEVIGSDVSADLAVLSATVPASEWYPLEIVSSSTARVGDYVVAIGSPYGLAGTMTTGIVSALDRTITITDDIVNTYEITGLIQTSAPINSGNSGGPLMTYDGKVIGITTAIVSDSDGLGFAVQSDTILSVIENVLT